MNDPFYMSCLDIYTSYGEDSQIEKLQEAIALSKPNVMPLLSWDIYMSHYKDKIEASVKLAELRQVLSFSKKFQWQNDIETEFNKKDYEALIITDKNQKIIWVNNGFTEMTGYSKTFALNKTPRFLQGEATDNKTKSRIREYITKRKPFKEILHNYKKDGTLYKCEVQVIPLYNKETTHFIAFEKQVV